MANVISPQQRALNFGAYTRQHIQTLGSQTGGAGSHFEFEVPKARLLQAINLLVEVELKASAEGFSMTQTTESDLMDLYNVLKRVSVDYNNGFSPIVGSGKDIAVTNMLRVGSDTILPSFYEDATMLTMTRQIDGEPIVINTTGAKFHTYSVALPEGKAFKYYFNLEIPLTLNDRDPAGLVLAQNGQTLINFSMDIESVMNIVNTIGSFNVDKVKVTPQLISFSIPNAENAFPDLSVLKVLDSRKETFTGGGSNLVKLPTGMIYRKIVLYFEDENGNPMDVDDITSNIELLLNTADIPYSINPRQLRLRTTAQTGGCLPKGYYAFDFSCQGTNPNYGGSRDYIDAETITTFEMRFTTATSGKVTIISEKISRLKASK